MIVRLHQAALLIAILAVGVVVYAANLQWLLQATLYAALVSSAAIILQPRLLPQGFGYLPLPEPTSFTRKDVLLPWLFGLVVMLGTLSFLEWTDPFYFTQDDNHRQFLPVIVGMLRDFYATGIYPTWNAYVGLGMPVINGGYAFSYPPLHAAYLLALASGKDSLTLEILAFMHFIAGYSLMFLALRRYQAGSLLTMVAAVGYVLSGYHLVIGRSWFSVTAIPVYMAAFLYLLAPLIAGIQVSRRWIVLLALTVGLFFHAGHTELWLYGMLCFALSAFIATLLTGKTGLKNMVAGFAGGLSGLALAAPLMFLQWQDLTFLSEMGTYKDRGMADYIYRIFYTWPFPTLNHKLFTLGLFHMATVLATAWMLVICVFRTPRHLPPLLALSAGFLLSLAFSLGDTTPLWTEVRTWTGFDRFRYLHKWVPFILAFSFALGTYSLSYLCRQIPGRQHLALRIMGYAVLGIFLTISVKNASMNVPPTTQLADAPYPPLEKPYEILRSRQQQGDFPYRVLSTAGHVSQKEHFVQRMGNNYPAYYQLFSADRYAQRISKTIAIITAEMLAKKNLKSFLNAYSIGALYYSKNTENNFDIAQHYPTNKVKRFADRLKTAERLPIKISDGELISLDTSHTAPLVNWRDKKTGEYHSLPFEAKPNGLVIYTETLPPEPTTITASFLTHKWFKATSYPDKSALNISFDSFKRIDIQPRPETKQIRLTFTPPWASGWQIAGILLVLGIILEWIYHARFFRRV